MVMGVRDNRADPSRGAAPPAGETRPSDGLAVIFFPQADTFLYADLFPFKAKLLIDRPGDVGWHPVDTSDSARRYNGRSLGLKHGSFATSSVIASRAPSSRPASGYAWRRQMARSVTSACSFAHKKNSMIT